jgi:hypothetical protein
MLFTYSFKHYGLWSLKTNGRENVGAVLVIEDNVLKGVLSEITPEKLYWKQSFKDTFVHEIMARDDKLVSNDLELLWNWWSKESLTGTGKLKPTSFVLEKG